MTCPFEIQYFTFGLTILFDMSVWETIFHFWFDNSPWHVCLRYNISPLVWQFSMTYLFEIQYYTFGLTILHDMSVWDTIFHFWFDNSPWHVCLRYNISPLVWQFSMTWFVCLDTILHIWFDNSLWHVCWYNISLLVWQFSMTCLFEIHYYTFSLSFLQNMSVWDKIFHLWFGNSLWHVCWYNISLLVWQFSMTCLFEIQYYTFSLSFLQNMSVWDKIFHLWFGNSLWHVCWYNISPLVWQFTMTSLFEIKYFIFGLAILYDMSVDTIFHFWFDNFLWHVCLRYIITHLFCHSSRTFMFQIKYYNSLCHVCLFWQFSMTGRFEIQYLTFSLKILYDISVWETILHIYFCNWFVNFPSHVCLKTQYIMPVWDTQYSLWSILKIFNIHFGVSWKFS